MTTMGMKLTNTKPKANRIEKFTEERGEITVPTIHFAIDKTAVWITLLVRFIFESLS